LKRTVLQDFLEPLGTVQRNFEIPGEPKYVDVWFRPNPETAIQADLGLLGRFVTTPCLLEPFRNAPKRQEIKTCILKLLWMQENQRRRADTSTLSHVELARLWILATRIDQPVIAGFGGQPHPDWPKGIYFVAEEFNTALVAINQLPSTPDTLWIRLLGRGATLEQAVSELLALPLDDNRRSQALQLLTNWRVSIQLENPRDDEEQELMATLSQAYLEWEQRTRAEGEQLGEQRGRTEGERSLILRQLTHRFGTLPTNLQTRIEQLPLEQLEALSLAWLDWREITELETWLQS
jgi:Domain of unknown function (DUF4351)